MSPERKRQVGKFTSQRSSEKWGLWCGIAFIITIIMTIAEAIWSLF